MFQAENYEKLKDYAKQEINKKNEYKKWVFKK